MNQTHRLEFIPALASGLLFTALLALFLPSAAPAAETTGPPTGEQMYHRYCASCHGPEAKGDGPVAQELRTRPSDLRTIAARSSGSYDINAVIKVIDGRSHVAAHGPREMPVWGAIFSEELRGTPYNELSTLLRAATLAEYLSTLQK